VGPQLRAAASVQQLVYTSAPERGCIELAWSSSGDPASRRSDSRTLRLGLLWTTISFPIQSTPVAVRTCDNAANGTWAQSASTYLNWCVTLSPLAWMGERPEFR
jgi:hypothetical protein